LFASVHVRTSRSIGASARVAADTVDDQRKPMFVLSQPVERLVQALTSITEIGGVRRHRRAQGGRHGRRRDVARSLGQKLHDPLERAVDRLLSEVRERGATGARLAHNGFEALKMPVSLTSVAVTT
jgi:hypothetical protein